ncbi:MAG TPA: sulfotransferase [Thermoanaerobaculia bacterium]|nr:sulfotransferase [Thermoanaerobaculia bacterium]
MSRRAGPVFILGVNRSGTSLIAELVYRWGAYGGDPARLSRGNSGNPRGYWEHEGLHDFLGDLANEVGLLHPSFRECVRQKAQEPLHRQRALRLIAEMEDGGTAWFWKDPLLSVMLPFWQEIVERPVYVVAVRNPADVAASWEEFTLPPGLPEGIRLTAASLLRWQHYTLSILDAVEASASKLFVAYEDVLESPEAQCARLSGFLDEHCGSEGAREGQRLPEMVQAVDASLHRHRSRAAFSQLAEATPEQKRLYDLLLGKVEDAATPYDARQLALYAGWREYLRNLALFSQLFAEARPILGSRAVRLLWALGRPLRGLAGALRGRQPAGPPQPAGAPLRGDRSEARTSTQPPEPG